MGVTVGSREKAILTQTLAPLLVGLVAHPNPVTIQLRSELQVEGRVQAVDCFMNVTLSDGLLSSPEGPITKFSLMCIQRKFIRALRIPDQIRVDEMLRDQVEIATGAKARAERLKAKKKRANYLRNKERKRMEKVD